MTATADAEEQDYRARRRGRRPARDGPRGRADARSTSSSAPAEQTPEHGWIRTWLDTVLELPWGVRTEDASTSPTPARCSTPTTPASTT